MAAFALELVADEITFESNLKPEIHRGSTKFLVSKDQ